MDLRAKRAKKRERRQRLLRERRDASPKRRKVLDTILARLAAQIQRINEAIHRAPGPPGWGGCRGVTNEIIRIVGDEASATSRKRWETFGNPGSDHHRSQLDADAVDFATANNYALRDKVMRRLGVQVQIADYGSYIVRHKGRPYRVQPIAGTHGTGPHLHFGVRRV